MTSVHDPDVAVADALIDAADVDAFAAATLDDPAGYAGGLPPLFVARLAVPVVARTVGRLLAQRPAPVLHVMQEFDNAHPLRVGQRVRLCCRMTGMADFGFAPAATLEVTATPVGALRPAVTSRSTFVLPGWPRTDRPPPRRSRVAARDLLRETELGLPVDMPARYAAASGDHNPIHIDDGAARDAGLPGVVVHGMCVFAAVAGTVRRVLARGHLTQLACRFVRPVVPGENIAISVFDTDLPDVVKVEVTQRGQAVLKDVTIGLR